MPVQAQQITLHFPDTLLSPSEVSIPITLSGEAWISRFNLQFSYWNSCAEFLSVESHHPPFNDTVEVSYNMGGATDWVGFHWDSPTPIFLQNSEILWVHMKFFGCYTELNWIDWADSICAFYDANGQMLNASFISGSINLLNGTPEIGGTSALSVFPNPYSGGDLTLHLPEVMKECQISVFDMYGKLVEEFVPENPSQELTLDESFLKYPSGAYSLMIRTGQKQYVTKLLMLRNY